MKSSLYTIGHSDLQLNQFIERLIENKVDVLCDVRSSPYSKRTPQFNRESLKSELLKANIKYVFLGVELGGRPTDPLCYENNQVNYIYQAKTDLFKAGLSRLEKGLQQFTPALMCAEKDPITCHRMLLVTRQLCDSNIEINHILYGGKVETNFETEQRLLDKYNLHPTLFDQGGHESLLSKAYELQGKQVAFKEKSFGTDQESAAWE